MNAPLRRYGLVAGFSAIFALAFSLGFAVAIVLIDLYGFHAKSEIDVVELIKIVLVATAAYLAKKYFDRREHASKAEEQILSVVIDETLKTAGECQLKFRECAATDSVSEAAREDLVGRFAQLENEVVAIEDLLRNLSIEPPSEMTTAFDDFADILTNDALDTPRLSRPAAEGAYRRLRVALHKIRLLTAHRF
jgi:hypothetical protein